MQKLEVLTCSSPSLTWRRDWCHHSVHILWTWAAFRVCLLDHEWLICAAAPGPLYATVQLTQDSSFYQPVELLLLYAIIACKHIYTKHILQYFLAVLPWWLHSSEHIGLSPIIRSTGAITSTFCLRDASNITIPSSSFNKLSTSGSANCSAFTLFEQHRKWMFSSCDLSSCGNPE